MVIGVDEKNFDEKNIDGKKAKKAHSMYLFIFSFGGFFHGSCKYI